MNFIKAIVTSPERLGESSERTGCSGAFARKQAPDSPCTASEKYAEVGMQGTAIMLDILANDKT